MTAVTAATPESPVRLHSGPLSAVLTRGALGQVRIGGLPALAAVYVAVRDQNWGTVSGEISEYQVRQTEGGFRVTFNSAHTTDELDYRWLGSIEGDAGTVVFTMDGTVGRAFRANRIGFCLLHPQDLKGYQVVARTVEGSVVGEFPRSISPHQPFLDLTGMAYDVAEGVHLDIDFEGDLFEVEDHRNWTDAGWKTYCTPLRLPYPADFRVGQRVRQVVTLRARIEGTAARPRAADRDRTQTITVRETVVGRLPTFGLGASLGDPPNDPPNDPPAAAALALVRELRPRHLYAELEMSGADIRSLQRAAHEAEATGARLDVGLVLRDGDDIGPIADLLLELGVELGRVLVFDAATWTTPPGAAASVRAALRERGMAGDVGGGSCGFFAELNRARLPVDELDWLTYGICPQVHHFDDASIMDTLPAQTDTVSDALRLGEGRPVVAGPVTLRMRVNPYATAGVPRQAPPADPRQATSFTAAWTVASIAALAQAQAITYFETVGPRGLIPVEPAVPFPVWHVFRALAGVADGELLAVNTDRRELGAVAVHSGGQVVVLVANLRDQPCAPRVTLEGVQDQIAVPLGGNDLLDLDRLELPPYGVAVVRGSRRAR